MSEELSKILDHIASLDKTVTSKLDAFDDRLTRLERLTGQHNDTIINISNLIEKIVNSDGVIKQTSAFCTMKKESVYEIFEDYGLDKYLTLKQMDELGYLLKDACGGRTRPVRTDNKVIRAIVIRLMR